MSTTGLMIDAIDLRRSFKDLEAVAGISFRVHHGDIFGLLGPNGAGKTTTIRLLTGQLDPNGGRAVVAGCAVVKDRARLKERIGVVFEEQNLYERLSAGNNLRFNCWLYGLPESRIDEVLDLVHLRERANDPVRTFSSGMKQRLMIACDL
jgi:ABC-2 type transport system ATP-binding protein